jgi:hypothetical protein
VLWHRLEAAALTPLRWRLPLFSLAVFINCHPASYFSHNACADVVAVSSMPEQERIEVIKRFLLQQEHAQRRTDERKQEREADLTTWKNAVLPLISQSVHAVSLDFGRRRSPFLLSSVPVLTEGTAFFRGLTNSGVRLLPKLQFDLSDGQVTATVNVGGTHLHATVQIKDVTREWVELNAERALIAMINAALK